MTCTGSGDTEHWYLLQCKPNQQTRAELHLRNQHYTLYTPTTRVQRIVRRQQVERTEPVFPGYLFIRLSQQSNWSALQSTRGVSRLVGFNGQPSIVPDSLVEALQNRFNPDLAATPLYAPGDKVRIAEGPFRDVEAIVKAVTPDARIVVLLNLLQGQHALTFPATQLSR